MPNMDTFILERLEKGFINIDKERIKILVTIKKNRPILNMYSFRLGAVRKRLHKYREEE